MPKKKILRDGEVLRVPLQLMDSLQKDVHAHYGHGPRFDDAKHYGLYPAGPGVEEGGACTIDGKPGALRKVEGGFLCVPIGEDAMPTINDSSPATVVDGFGNSGLALNKPGARYLTAGAKAIDHALQIAREFERGQAYADSVRDLTDAWKSDANSSTREIARIHNKGDARTDAYLDQLHDLQNAWKGPVR
jgi:hypothetical protein